MHHLIAACCLPSKQTKKKSSAHIRERIDRRSAIKCKRINGAFLMSEAIKHGFKVKEATDMVAASGYSNNNRVAMTYKSNQCYQVIAHTETKWQRNHLNAACYLSKASLALSRDLQDLRERKNRWQQQQRTSIINLDKCAHTHNLKGLSGQKKMCFKFKCHLHELVTHCGRRFHFYRKTSCNTHT